MKSFYVSCTFALVSFILVCQARIFHPEVLSAPVQDERSIRMRRDVKIETLNETLDVILREVRGVMRQHEMDPLNAANQTESLYLSTLYMNNIKVNNLSTIRRYGDIIMLDNEPGRKLTTRVRLTFDDLQVIADYKASSLLLASMGKVITKIPELTVDFTLEVDFENVKLTMLSFEMTKNDASMQIRFSGNIESIVFNLLTRIGLLIVSNVLLTIIQGPVKNQLDEILLIVNNIMQETLTSVG